MVKCKCPKGWKGLSVAAVILIMTIVAFGAVFSIGAIQSPSLTYIFTAELQEAQSELAGKNIYSVVTPPIKTGDYRFIVSSIEPGQVCFSSPESVCIAQGERKVITEFIEGEYLVRSLIEEDDKTFVGDINIYVDVDNSMIVLYDDRTGLQLNENFKAPYTLQSKWSKKIDAGMVLEQRSLLLERTSQSQINEPRLMADKSVFEVPIATNKLGLSETKARPYIRFSREDRTWDVSAMKSLIVNYRISPLVEGQTKDDLPPGSIGDNVDPDSPTQRIFVQPLQNVQESISEPSSNIVRIIIGCIIIAIGIVLIVVVVQGSMRKK